MIKNSFNTRNINKEAYNKILEIHNEIDAEKQSEEPNNKKLMHLYAKELNASLFLGGSYIRNYGINNPY